MLEFSYPDTVFCVSRGMVLGILLSSEVLLARRQRFGFERHIILFSTFGFLLLAELWGALIGLAPEFNESWRPSGMWVWYPLLSGIGLLGLMLWFDYVRSGFLSPGSGRTGRRVRRNSHYYLMVAAFMLALGAILCDRPFAEGAPPTSIEHMGPVAYVLHGVRIAVLLALAVKSVTMIGKWLSRMESQAFLIGCAVGLAGAVWQLWAGPREHLTTLAYTFFVAVFLRDNYRRSKMDAVRAAEDRGAKMLLFHRITTQLKSTLEIPDLCDILMNSLVSNLGAQSGGIYIRTARNGMLQPILIHGDYPPPLSLAEGTPEEPARLREVLQRTPIAYGQGIVGAVAETGNPSYIYNESDSADRYLWPTGPARVQSAIALPLRSPEGVFGVVQVVNRTGGGSFDEEDLRFASLLVEQAALAIYNAKLHEEIVERQRTEQQIRVARQIQQRLIPSDLPSIPGVALGVEYRAAQEVGGDYYDFYRIDHDHLGILIFDVSGKGVPGAMLMAITRTFLKMAALRSNSPAWVLNEVNAALSAELRRGMFITAVYCVLKLSTLELALCCAGHTSTLLLRDRDGACEQHKPRGAALGLLRPNRFRRVLEQKTIQLEPGDTLLLYTDGVTEALNTSGVEFGEERLVQLAGELARKGPKTLAAGICEAVEEHAAGAPQYDDITLVALRAGVDAPEPAEPGAS